MKSKFTPPDYILLFIAFEIIGHYLFPIKQIIYSPNVYFGIPLVALGVYLNNFWVYFTFKKEKTTVRPYEKPKKLVTYGAFNITRNPVYLGMFCTLLGFSILLGSLISFLFPIVFFLLTNIFVIPYEERILERKFGKTYIDYKKKVRRWI